MAATTQQLEKRVIWLVVLFLLIGQIALFSATGILGLQQYGSEFYYVIRQSACALAGLLLMFGLSLVRYQVWSKLAYPIIFVQLLLTAATLFPQFSHEVQGVRRWLRIGPLTFQPSELAKISLAIYTAYLLVLREQYGLTFKRTVARSIPILILLFVIFQQPDFGSTILLTCMVLGLLFMAGIRGRTVEIEWPR